MRIQLGSNTDKFSQQNVNIVNMYSFMLIFIVGMGMKCSRDRCVMLV